MPRIRGESVQATAAFDEKPGTSAVQQYAPGRPTPSIAGPVRMLLRHYGAERIRRRVVARAALDRLGKWSPGACGWTLSL